MFQLPIATKLIAGAGAGLLLLGATTTAVVAANTTATPTPHSAAAKPSKTDRHDHRVAATAYLEASASVLGLSPADLKAAFKSGKSLSDLATAKGFSKETFGAGVQKAIAPLLAADVKSGKLTDKESARIQKRLAAGKLPFWERHHHHHHKASVPKT